MQAISLYWFAAQHTNTAEIYLLLREISGEFNEISLFFYKQQEGVEKWPKLK